MQDHLIQQHFARIVHTHGDHGETVANKHNVYAGMIGDMTTREVMSSNDSDRFLFTVKTLNGVDGNRLPCGECCTQG